MRTEKRWGHSVKKKLKVTVFKIKI